MKRLPRIVSFVLFIVLCASAAYWAMQLFKPPVRPVAAPPRAAKPEVKPESAAALLGGGRSKVAVASNYQLHGVVVSGTGSESVAILSADGKPAQAVRMEREVMPGVTVKEVHKEYVLLSEGGVTKRVELPESAKGQVDIATVSPVRTAPGQPALTRPPPVAAPPAPPAAATGAPPQMGYGSMPPGPPGPPSSMVSPGSVPPPGNSAVNPPPSPEPPAPVVAVPGSPPAPAVSSGSSGTSGATGVPGAPGVPGVPGVPGTPGVPGAAPGTPSRTAPTGR